MKIEDQVQRTQRQADELIDGIRKAAKAAGMSLGDAALAAENLARAGYSAEDILKAGFKVKAGDLHS